MSNFVLSDLESLFLSITSSGEDKEKGKAEETNVQGEVVNAKIVKGSGAGQQKNKGKKE